MRELLREVVVVVAVVCGALGCCWWFAFGVGQGRCKLLHERLGLRLGAWAVSFGLREVVVAVNGGAVEVADSSSIGDAWCMVVIVASTVDAALFLGVSGSPFANFFHCSLSLAMSRR